MTKEEIQKKYFTDDEEILWFDAAKNVGIFTTSDIFLIPLTLFVGGFLLFYAFSSMILMFRGESIAFSLSGITMILIALYLIFGRIWYRYKRVSKNLYFVTSKRIFIFNTLRDTVSAEIPLADAVPCVRRNALILSDQYPAGDIVFGLGLDLFFRSFVRETPAFTGIENPSEVLQVIQNAKKSRKAAEHDSDFI